jgi:hypothetical protein
LIPRISLTSWLISSSTRPSYPSPTGSCCPQRKLRRAIDGTSEHLRLYCFATRVASTICIAG